MINVLGAGAFGTSLAISLSADGTPVTLVARSTDSANLMQKTRQNAARLPDIAFPASLVASDNTESISPESVVLLAAPMQQLRALIQTHASVLSGKNLVACCKGVELATGHGPIRILNDLLPDSTAALLTGPSFARDIASGLPTALTLACQDKKIGKSLQQSLTTNNLRLYRTTDTTGAELGGALKNVIAIASGAVIGAGLGDSARAALMTRGFAEMKRMAVALGARAETLSGLSGFGDLVLTCTSDQSRNFRFGLALGRNLDFDTDITVEGAATARAVKARAKDMQIEMPITEAVVALLDGDIQVQQAMNRLLARPLKEE